MSRSALCSLYGYGRVWGINRDTIIRSTIRTEQGYGRAWGINRDTIIRSTIRTEQGYDRVWGIRQDTMKGRGLQPGNRPGRQAILCPSWLYGHGR